MPASQGYEHPAPDAHAGDAGGERAPHAAGLGLPPLAAQPGRGEKLSCRDGRPPRAPAGPGAEGGGLRCGGDAGMGEMVPELAVLLKPLRTAGLLDKPRTPSLSYFLLYSIFG